MRDLQPVSFNAEIPAGGAWTTVSISGLAPEGRPMLQMGSSSTLGYRFLNGATTVIEGTIDGFIPAGIVIHPPNLVLQFSNGDVVNHRASVVYTAHL